ncbi:MAG: hypothetical protein ACI3VB_01690 [Oscillospiraceae bacterium]
MLRFNMGHSGGATLMTAYQHAAEHGIKSLHGEEKLIKCSLKMEAPVAGQGARHRDRRSERTDFHESLHDWTV